MRGRPGSFCLLVDAAGVLFLLLFLWCSFFFVDKETAVPFSLFVVVRPWKDAGSGGCDGAPVGGACSLRSGSDVGGGGGKEPRGTGRSKNFGVRGRSKNLGVRGGRRASVYRGSCTTLVYGALPYLGCTGLAWRIRRDPCASSPPMACPAGHRHGRPALPTALPRHAVSQRPPPPTGAHRGPAPPTSAHRGYWQEAGVLIGPMDDAHGCCAGSTRQPPASGRLQKRLVRGPAAPGGSFPPAVARGPVGPAGWLGWAGWYPQRGPRSGVTNHCWPLYSHLPTHTDGNNAQHGSTPAYRKCFCEIA